MSELPKGWVTTTFDDVISSMTNGVNGKQNKSGDGKPVSRIETIAHQVIDYSRIGYIADYDEEKIEKYLLKNGDILFSHINSPIHLGKTAIFKDKEKLYHGVNLLRITLNDSFSPSLFNYYCKYARALGEFSSKAQHAVNQSSLNQKKLKLFNIPLLPLNEQKRIVDKLDLLLAKVDKAQTRLEKIPTILKRFRQSVLASATSGELTKEWRAGTKGTVTVQSTWEISNLPKDWDVKLLPEVASSRLGKMLDKSKNEGVATKYLGNINVRWNYFDLEVLKEILVSEKEISELSIINGDLIICEGGVPGRGAIWRGGDNNLVFQKALHRIRFDDSIIPEFALYCIENDFESNRLPSLYTGTTIKHLTGKSLKVYPLRVPPIAEQKEIIERVEALLTKADKAKKQYKEAKAKIDRLTQSILAKAFHGELVPQDESDEPAEQLLARIQESMTKPKAKAKKKAKK